MIVVRDPPADLGAAKSDATDSLEEGLVDGITERRRDPRGGR